MVIALLVWETSMEVEKMKEFKRRKKNKNAEERSMVISLRFSAAKIMVDYECLYSGEGVSGSGEF